MASIPQDTSSTEPLDPAIKRAWILVAALLAAGAVIVCAIEGLVMAGIQF